MRRSVGVTVIAILAIIGSAGAIGTGALTFVGLLAGAGAPPKDFSGSLIFFRAIVLLAPLIYILPGGWGIATATGLLQLKNWARISIIIFSVLLLAFGLITGLSSSVFFLTNPPPGLDRQGLAFVRVFMLMLAAGQIGLGIWWLVFFNRAKVKEQFVAPPMFAGYPGAPAGYPIQGAYHVQPPPGASVPMAPTAIRRPLSLSIIAWIMLVACLFFPVNIALHTPAILLVKVLTGWQATVVMSLYEVLGIFIGVGLLRLKPAARYVGIGYFVFSVLNIVVFNFAPGGHARVMKLLEAQRSAFPWMRDTPSFHPQPDPTAFFLIISVTTLVCSLAPLYFLIKEKQAFQKAAAHAA